MKIDLTTELLAPDETIPGTLSQALYAVLMMPDMSAPYEEKERRVKLAVAIVSGEVDELTLEDWGYVTERAKLHPNPAVAVAAVTVLRAAAKEPAKPAEKT